MATKTTKGRRDLAKEKLWRGLMAQRQQNSGQSVCAFCKEAGVTESQFYRWRTELRLRDAAPSPPPGFAEVIRRAPSAAPASSGVSLELPGGQKILLACDFDVSVLRTVVSALDGSVRT